MKKINKLKPGDKVAILSPSFAAPGMWPHVYELGKKRLQEDFDLIPVEYPTTSKLGATTEERSNDLVAAFQDPQIKGIITSIGGDDQVTYVKNLPKKPFTDNPKPFFGYSDNTHFINFLFSLEIPTYYGGALFLQFAEPGSIHSFTDEYLRLALFENKKVYLKNSSEYSDIALDWASPQNLTKKRTYEKNYPWHWSGSQNTKGILWGGCLESIDKMIKHDIPLPTLEQFENIILITETSEGIPSSEYAAGVYEKLGEMGVLEKIKGVLVGRPKAWDFGNQKSTQEKEKYRKSQKQAIEKIVRKYDQEIPIVQNLDFGHTEPQIPMPIGKQATINSQKKTISIQF